MVYQMTPCVQGKDGGEHTITSFDDVLHVIGQRGRFQGQLLLTLILVSMSVGYQNFSPVFTLHTPKHRCTVPGVPNDTYAMTSGFHFEIVNETIPTLDKGGFDQCNIYEHTYLKNDTTRVELRRCSQWVFDKSVFESTIPEDLSLVCDRKIMRSHSNMLIFAGKFFGAILQGIASDIFGRQKVLIVTSLGMLVCSVGNAFVTTTESLFALRFLTGMTTTASYLAIFVLAMEFMGPSHRTTVTTITRCSFVIAQLALDGAAYLERDWKILQLSLTWPCVLLVLCLWMVPESPRWLLAKGQTKEMEKIIQHAARRNKATLPKNALSKLMQVENCPAPAIHLFTDIRLVVRWTIVYINWVVIAMVYYGLTLNVSNLSGNIFINFLASVSTEAVGLVLVAKIVPHVSRKSLHAAAMLLSGVACTATFIPILLGSQRWIIITLSMIGKLGISCAFYLIYTYTAELFPTTHRGFGMGSSSMIARVGGMASPYVADLNTYIQGGFGQVLPQLVFGVAGIIGGLLALLLPDTRDKKLPETIADAKSVKAVPVSVDLSSTKLHEEKKTGRIV